MQSLHLDYLNCQLKEPDNVKSNGEDNDADDEEPSLAQVGWLEIKMKFTLHNSCDEKKFIYLTSI